jgi:hypothetical protein
MAKPIAEDEELLYMIDHKRKVANNALGEVVRGLVDGQPSFPLDRLMDYLTNMVSALELMLKLLSKDSESHNFAGMFHEVFKRDHPDQAFMEYLGEAMRDQKYLAKPVDNAKWFKEMEDLFAMLYAKIAGEEKYQLTRVSISVTMPREFTEFLRDHVQIFIGCHLWGAEERAKLNEFLTTTPGCVTFKEHSGMARAVAKPVTVSGQVVAAPGSGEAAE